MVMPYSHAKVEGQRPVVSEDRAETNGQTDVQTEREFVRIPSPKDVWHQRTRVLRYLRALFASSYV